MIFLPAPPIISRTIGNIMLIRLPPPWYRSHDIDCTRLVIIIIIITNRCSEPVNSDSTPRTA